MDNKQLATDAEIENIVNRSFLARVPALLLEGHSMEQALRLAYNQEEAFLLEMQIGSTKRAKMAREVMTTTVYNRINKAESFRRMEARLDRIDAE